MMSLLAFMASSFQTIFSPVGYPAGPMASLATWDILLSMISSSSAPLSRAVLVSSVGALASTSSIAFFSSSRASSASFSFCFLAFSSSAFFFFYCSFLDTFLAFTFLALSMSTRFREASFWLIETADTLDSERAKRAIKTKSPVYFIFII